MLKFGIERKRRKSGPKVGPFGTRISLGIYMAQGLVPMFNWLCERDNMSKASWLENQVLKEYRAANGEALPVAEEVITLESGATIALSEDK